MKRIATALFLTGAFLWSAATAGAATVVRYSHTQSNFPSGTSVADVDIDSANRVWFVTNNGVTALSGTTTATGFPLYSSLDGYTDLSSVAFGPVTGEPTVLENFFLGSNSSTAKKGILYGRMLTSPTLPLDHELGPELTANGRPATWSEVNALASDRATTLWIATNAGLAWADLPSLAVSVHADLTMPDPVIRVVSADFATSGGDAFFSTAFDLYLAKLVPAPSKLHFAALKALTLGNGIGGLTLDSAGNLWVAEASASGEARRIFRYEAADLLAWAQNPGTVSEPTPEISLFDPGATGSVYTAARDIQDLGVNPLTGEVWVATELGAFYQAQDPAGSGLLAGQKLCGLGAAWAEPADDVDAADAICNTGNPGWHPMPQQESETQQAGFGGENFRALLLDAAGNAWLGSDRNIRGVIARSMTLSSGRYVGVGAKATVSVSDDTKAGQGVVVTVSVGGVSADLPVTLDAAGNGTVTFGFTYADSDPNLVPHLFTVTKTAAGVPITATYEFVDALGNPGAIIAESSWAEIVPFEDDLWIGGPCFLRLLEAF